VLSHELLRQPLRWWLTQCRAAGVLAASRCPGCVDNRPTDRAGSGHRTNELEYVTGRGYAVASLYSGDVDPDKPDFTDGVHPHYFKPGQTQPAPHDWGTIAAWAWGIFARSGLL